MPVSRLNTRRGFTLIEILVVVTILGILVGIVVPRILDRPEEARRTRAAADIRGIGEALGMFRLDNGFYPSTEQGLRALVEKPQTGRIPTRYPDNGYLRRIPLDPWGNPYVYLSPGLHDEYDLLSYGADGEPGGEGNNAEIRSWELD